MNSLIRCAADRFAHHSQESWTEEDFFAAVKLVYTETSDPQRLLRSTIVKVIRERYIGDEPWKMVFSNLLDTTPGLAADALRAVTQTPTTPTSSVVKDNTYRCPVVWCDEKFQKTMLESQTYRHRCHLANFTFAKTGKDWEKYIFRDFRGTRQCSAEIT